MIYDTHGNIIGIYKADGTPVLGGRGPATPPRQPAPPAGPVLNILQTGSSFYTARTWSDPGGTISHAFEVTVDAVAPRLYWSAVDRYAPPAAHAMQVLITQGGRTIPVKVAGSPTISVPSTPGWSATSDPLDGYLLAGEPATMHVWASGPARWADQSGMIDPATDGLYRMGTGLAPGSTPGTATARPAAILAPSDQPSWLINGDSNSTPAPSYGDLTFYALGHASTKAAYGGRGHPDGATGWANVEGKHDGNWTHLYDQLGGNDSTREQSLNYWRYVRANHPVQFILKTAPTPTTMPGEENTRTVRTAIIAWLRDGAPLTPDGAAVAEPGATDAIRCTRVTHDGILIPGDPTHPVDLYSDASSAVDDVNNPNYYNAEAAPLAGPDKLHIPRVLHDRVAERLVRDLRIFGF